MAENLTDFSNYLTFAQAADLLGIARSTIYNFVNRGWVHPIRVGKYSYLNPDEITEMKNNWTKWYGYKGRKNGNRD